MSHDAPLRLAVLALAVRRGGPRSQGSGCVLAVGRRWLGPAAVLQRVHHGHVHVEVVGLLEALAAQLAGKLQLLLGLVLRHVVFEGGALAALEPAHLTPVRGTERGLLRGLRARLPHAPYSALWGTYTSCWDAWQLSAPA